MVEKFCDLFIFNYIEQWQSLTKKRDVMLLSHKAVLFDMDGVLVDTEPVIQAAAIEGLAEYGVDAKPEDFIPFIGAGEDRFIGGVAEKYDLAYKPEMKDRVYQIYFRIVRDRIRLHKGAKNCLGWLQKNGIVAALVSSADRIKIAANLEAAGLEPRLFAEIISAENVVHKKPAPDIYFEAAKRLSFLPENCIVIEDAITGIQAAKAANMICIAVTTTFAREKLEPHHPHYICDDLDQALDILKKVLIQ